MGLSKYRIGDLIEPFSKKCGISDLQPNDVSGINIDKEFFEPAKQVGEDTCGYKIVPPNYFACNLMHVGRDEVLPVALNHSGHNKIVSPAYSVFRIKNEDIVMKEYFFILLKSSEKDRYFWFHTDSSIRQGLPWEDFCDIDITLPSIEQQRKYVDVYLSLQNNLATYQSKVDDLKLVCDGYIEDLRRKMPCEKIGQFIMPIDNRNSDLKIKLAQGITNDKEFANPKQVAEAETSAKIVRRGQFAYNRATTRNGEKISIAYRTGDDCVVSSAYQVFEIVAKDKLYPEYLMMWYKRAEFDRYARYMSKGSAHEFFEYEDMEDVQIPIPSLEKQKAIVSIYNVYKERKAIAAQLKEQLNNLCPILIKGSLQN